MFCLMLIQQVFAQSWVGIKYTGGFPGRRVFSRGIEYCNGLNIERFSTNILGEDAGVHDWRFGFQADFIAGNGIKKDYQFPGITPATQTLQVTSFAVGAMLSTRYTFLKTSWHPYGEFSVGVRNFTSTLDIAKDTRDHIQYVSNQSYTSYCLGTGFMYDLTDDIKFDFGITYNIGKKVDLYDFNSVYANGGTLYATAVKSGTSSLQFEAGFVFNVRRQYNNRSIFRNLGTGNSLLELLLF